MRTASDCQVTWQGTCNKAQEGSPSECFDNGAAEDIQMKGFIEIVKPASGENTTSLCNYSLV